MSLKGQRCVATGIAGALWFAPMLGWAVTDNGTLTVGKHAAGNCGGIPAIHAGYIGSLSVGSYSPTGLTGGNTVSIVIDFWPCSGSQLTVTGFSSNPGKSWLTSITCNGVTNSSAAAGFVYNAGSATWTWGQFFGLAPLPLNTNVLCAMVH